MAKKFASKLTDAQFKLACEFERANLTTISQAVKAFERDARVFERANLTTISQAVKAFECDDRAQIELWKKQLAEWQKVRDAEADELTDNFLPGLAIHLLRVATRTNSPTTADMNLKREDTEHDKRKHDPTTDASAQ